MAEYLLWLRESAGQSPVICLVQIAGGKSGLHRAGCQVTPGGREPTESAAESRPPAAASAAVGKGERVR